MTLRELKEMVLVAKSVERVPSYQEILRTGAEVVVGKKLGEESELMVFNNGYVAYIDDSHVTVFPLHACGGYAYESVMGITDMCGADMFEDASWDVRLLMEGMDRIEKSRNNIMDNHGVVSYSSVAEDWSVLADRKPEPLEEILERERMTELMGLLTERQQYAVYSYYCENMAQDVIAKNLGISQQATAGLIRRAIKLLRKEYGLDCDLAFRVRNEKKN